MTSSTDEVSIDRSLDAATLRALSERWSALRAAASADPAALREVERGYEAHRAKLFLENATLQADGSAAHSAGSARLESNQLAIKASTVALAELREALAAPAR